jgi:hypothetical protein
MSQTGILWINVQLSCCEAQKRTSRICISEFVEVYEMVLQEELKPNTSAINGKYPASELASFVPDVRRAPLRFRERI